MLNNAIAVYAPLTPPAPLNSYESIATLNGSGSSATITFSSIPSTYKHLQLRATILATASNNSDYRIRVNGATSGYSWHQVSGDGSSASALGYGSIGYGMVALNASSNTYPYTMVIDLLDYANTNKFKTIRSLGGGDKNGSGSVALMSDSYQSTTAISSIEIYSTADNFATSASFALYGLKG